MLKVNMRTGETEQCSLLDLMDTRGRIPLSRTSGRILRMRFRENCAMTLLFLHNKEVSCRGRNPSAERSKQ